MLIIENQPIVKLVNDHLIDYPTPSNISVLELWLFGWYVLGIQIITGILLAMHYTTC